MPTEVELYDILNAYLSEHRTPKEGEQRTLLLICMAETTEQTHCDMLIIDPGVPATIDTKTAFALTLMQQVAVTVRKPLCKFLKKYVSKTMMVRKMTEKIGLDNILKVRDTSVTEAEFKTRIYDLMP